MSGLARATIGVVGFLVAIIGLGVLGFTYLLARGPVDLENVKPRLLAALQERLGDQYRVSLGSTFILQPSNGFGIGFGFSGIEIDDAKGRMLLSAPGGRLSLDLLALMNLQVHVKRLQIEHLVLNMRIRTDGQWEFGAGASDDGAAVVAPPQAPASGGPMTPGAAVAMAISALQGEEQPLDHVSIADGRLKVVNQTLGRTTIFENFAIAYDRRGDSAELNVSARGPSGPWRAYVAANFGPQRRISIEAKDLSFDDLALLNSRKPGFFVDMPISWRLSAALDEKGAIAHLDAGFGLGAGYFRLADPEFEPILVDETTGEFSYDPAKGQFRIKSIEALLGQSHYRFTGFIAPPPTDAGPWSVHLQSNDSVLASERLGGPEVTLDEVEADARVFADSGRLVVDKARIHGPKVQGELSAELLQRADGPELKLSLAVSRSDLRTIIRIWPAFINPDARKWCSDHLHAGDLGGATMRLDWGPSDLKAMSEKRAVAADSFRGDFTFIGAATDVLDGLPQLTGLDATGYITGRVFEVHAPHGVITFPSGRKLEAADAYFRVPDTAPAAIVAGEGGAHVTGGAAAVAELLSQEAIHKFAGLMLDPATVKGQAQGQLSMNLAMGKTATPKDQKFRVTGSLTALQLDKYAGNSRFDQGSIDFDADTANLRASGQGALNGVPAKVELAKSANDDGVMALLLTLDDAMRQKLGFNFGLSMTGVMTVKLKAPFGQGAAEAEADLSKVEIGNLDGSALKPAGKPGRATFTLKSAADGVSVGGIAVDAGALVARGSAQFGSDGGLLNAKLTQLKLAGSDDLKLDVTGGATIKAILRGASLDGRSVVKALLSRDAGSNTIKGFDVDARVGSVMGLNGAVLENAEIVYSRRGGISRSLAVVGRLGRSAFDARKEEDGPLRVRTDDAGALARFLDIYQRLEGGSLDLTLRDAADGGHGQATLRRFELRNETALRKMEATAPSRAAGIKGNDAVGATGSEALRFDLMTATFVRSAGRIDITDVAVHSATQGLTLQGVVDFARDRLNISGVFVPAYGVNSLMNHIPLVGEILAGGKDEGVFAVNFRVSGALSSPTLTFNPLSGVTPGIFRKIFGVFDGTSATQPPRSPDE